MDSIPGSSNTSAYGSQNASNKTQDKEPHFKDFFAMLEYFRQLTTHGDAGGGNKHIQLNGWPSELCVGNGNTKQVTKTNLNIRGSDGNDMIQSKQSLATIWGGAGNDAISAESNLVMVDGEKGNDSIQAIGDFARIYGGSGNDILGGSGFHQSLKGGPGQDDIFATGNAARIYGGTGNDTITVKDSEHASYFSRETPPQNRSDPIDSAPAFAHKLVAGTCDKFFGVDSSDLVATYPEQTTDVFGGTGDDTINLENTEVNIHFNAGDGQDTVFGGTLNDTLVLGKSLSYENATYELKENNLTIGFEGSDDQVILKGWSIKTSPKIQFSNGTTVTGEDIQTVMN